jgi:hypothetical protein
MYAKLHTVFDTESGERIRLGFNCMPVVKKSQVLSANAALQAKIRELEARFKNQVNLTWEPKGSLIIWRFLWVG